MTLRQAFAGMLQFFAVLALLGVGLFLVALFFLPELCFSVERMLQTKPDRIAMIGVCFIGFSWLLCLGFLSVFKAKILLLRLGTSVDVKLIRQTVAPLLQKQFGPRIRLRDVQILKGKELSLGVQLGPMNDEEREELLLEAEQHLKTLLSERFGYRKAFTMQAMVD